MAIAVADLSYQTEFSVAVSSKITVLIIHGCPLFRVGLRSLLAQQDDCQLVGEATHLEDVLTLAKEQGPDVVLLDGGLTTADPLDIVAQLRQAEVPGIMVFAPPTGNEETLFRFLMHGAMAYEDGTISGEELLAKLHRVALGECLVTGEVLVAQAVRRSRLAHLRWEALLAMSLTETSLPVPQAADSICSIAADASPLSEQERAILEQIARGRTTAQVARALGIGPHIVKNRLDRLFRKLDVHDRTSAVVMALRNQWIAIDRIPSVSL